MKILHVCLSCFYIDNYSYQENLLPKYHKKLGYDVEIIASTLSFDSNGKACNIEAKEYMNENNIKVTRLNYKKFILKKVAKFIRVYDGFEQKLYEAKPDIIFIHGCQFIDIYIIKKYAKKNNVIIYVDNHADFSNSARNIMSKKILHGFLWKRCAQCIEPYVTKFYGVLPARVDFLKNIYKIPEDKCELLVMGADDELIKAINNTDNIKKIRKKYNISNSDYVIITGGKIDNEKKQIILLEKVIKYYEEPNVKLIIFGSIIPELKDKILSYCDDERIIYVGWLNSKETYEYIAAADLAIYPGRHSVLWEQTVGLGIPMIVKYWKGTTHIDIGGNIRFLRKNTEKEIKEAIKEATNKKNFSKMKEISVNRGMKKFSYLEIAKESINMNKDKID